jgi:diacylglycerol kinase family enzyme
MTIRPGEEWGVAVERPDDLVELADDAALAAAADGDGPPLTVTGGDLHRALGAPRPRPTMQRIQIDALRVDAGGAETRAVAHVLVRRSWWFGPVIAVMNVDHIGDWNVAPRAHPNDGRFDTVELDGRMGVRQRWSARGRLRQGTHVPHPRIATGRHTHAEWTFDRPMSLWIDGIRRGRVRRLSVTIEPDALTLHI